MPLRDIARLLVKIAGLVVIVSAVIDLPVLLARSLPVQEPMTARDVVTMALVPPAIAALIGIVMFWGAGRIVDRLLVEPAAPGQGTGLDLRAIEEIAIAALGLYFVATAIADAFYYWGKAALYYRVVTENGYPIPPITPDDFAGFVSTAARLAIGVVLVLLSRGIVAVRRRLLSLRPITGQE
ncbi:hypothetical protein AB4Z01_24960 [Inquilinus sp. YAF38]|uniref:hypothetical protein n=1 Tax=Inquilinus sp. YAF38 TaxID=3233084 RepID=UPI003F8F702B